VATRPTALANFSATSGLSNVNSAAEDYNPSISPSGKVLYFNSNRDGSSYKIYKATLGPGGGFGAPLGISELNGTWNTGAPVPSADDLTIFMSSDRIGGQGSQDIWIARRASVNDPFGAPANVSELNTANNDQPGWLSPDGCRLYFNSDRPGGFGASDLYVAERPK
jgi:Tol biopolymer transport system component